MWYICGFAKKIVKLDVYACSYYLEISYCFQTGVKWVSLFLSNMTTYPVMTTSCSVVQGQTKACVTVCVCMWVCHFYKWTSKWVKRVALISLRIWGKYCVLQPEFTQWCSSSMYNQRVLVDWSIPIFKNSSIFWCTQYLCTLLSICNVLFILKSSMLHFYAVPY